MIRQKKASELGREGCEALLRKPAFDEVELGEKAKARIKESFGEELSAVQVVQRIVDDVRRRKNEALCDYTRRFDGVQLTADTLEVTAAEWEEACQRWMRRCWQAFAGRWPMCAATTASSSLNLG